MTAARRFVGKRRETEDAELQAREILSRALGKDQEVRGVRVSATETEDDGHMIIRGFVKTHCPASRQDSVLDFRVALARDRSVELLTIGEEALTPGGM